MSTATPSPSAEPGPSGGTLDDYEPLKQGDFEGGYVATDFPDPIDHGMGIQAVLEDLDHDADSTYARIFRAWQERVGDRDSEPYVLVEDVHERFDWLNEEYPAHLCLKSKGYMLGQPTEDGLGQRSQYYEYSLQVIRYDPESDNGEPDPSFRAPVSYQAWVRPENEDLVYKSGDHYTAQHGEGTKFHVQTTYASTQDALVRTIEVANAALAALDEPRPDWRTFNRDSWKVWKGEVHHRINKEYMDVAVNQLREAKTLLEYGGASTSGENEARNGHHVKERFTSDRWDLLGFHQPDGLEIGVKCYRMGSNPADERLRHPKVEAFLGKTDDDTDLPHADEWNALRGYLRQIASSFTVRSGVALGDLVKDDYYEAWDRDMVDFPLPEGWRRAQREANEVRERKVFKITMESLSKSKWDVLYAVALYEGLDYDTLCEVTGLSYDYVRELVAELADEDVLVRATYPRIVMYHNEELRVNALEKLREVYDDELSDIRDRGDERRAERQRERERRADADPGEESEADSGGAGADESDETPPAHRDVWQSVEELRYSAADIGRYLERGEIDPSDVRVRTSAYSWLGSPS